MRCVECGRGLRETASSCGFCGAAVPVNLNSAGSTHVVSTHVPTRAPATLLRSDLIEVEERSPATASTASSSGGSIAGRTLPTLTELGVQTVPTCDRRGCEHFLKRLDGLSRCPQCRGDVRLMSTVAYTALQRDANRDEAKPIPVVRSLPPVRWSGQKAASSGAENLAPAQLQLPLAGRGARLGARLIDNCLISVGYWLLFLLAAVVLPLPLVVVVLFGEVVAVACYAPYCLSRYGQTLGKRALGIRVVRVDGRPMSFGTAFARELVLGLTCCFIVGYFSTWFDSSGRRRGWHDEIANDVVVMA